MSKNSTREINEKTPLMVIAGPMFLELFLNTMLNNVDTIMLSRFDRNAVGAIGNANTVMFMMNILFNIIATATAVVVAQYLGAKQNEKMNMIYTLSVIVNFVLGIVLSGAMVAASPLISTILHIQPSMRNYFITYVMIVGGFGFLSAVYNVMLQILRCNGFPKVGMYVTIAVNIVNIFGNYAFLYGPLKYLNLGVAGVAISTVAARAIALTVAFIFFFARGIGKISLKTLKPFPFDVLVNMIKIGLPSAGENLSYNLYQMALLSFVNMMGEDSVNARSYCNALISFAMIFSNASAMATQIITGHLVGAGKEDLAYKKVFRTLRTSMPITIVLAVTNRLICPYTLLLFDATPEIIAFGKMIMFVDIFIEIGRCLNMTFVCSLKAAGSYVFPLVVGLFTMWILGLGMGYTLGVAFGIGVAGIYAGTATDECIRGLIVMRYWAKKKWYGKAIVQKKEN